MARSMALSPVLAASLLGTPAVAVPVLDEGWSPPQVSAEISLEVEPEAEWAAPLDSYRLTGRYGQSSRHWAREHTGLDFAAPSGTPIHAVRGGTVTETGRAGAYGLLTVITDDEGREYWYAHQSSIEVSPGDTVETGDRIGRVGSTGNSTGAHLHLEVRVAEDQPVDPEVFLAEHGVHP